MNVEHARAVQTLSAHFDGVGGVTHAAAPAAIKQTRAHTHTHINGAVGAHYRVFAALTFIYVACMSEMTEL